MDSTAMTYPEAIDWLFSTQMFGIKLGLDGPRQLLKKYLAYPPAGVKVIHVAGTNGKGSTCAMIDSLARAAGYRTGLFTSPHLIDFRERVRVSGAEIGEEETAAKLTELRALCESLDPHPTFFEITLALAMKHFRERECELIVLETGMGGRLDATTAVPADVAVITPIGLDHMQFLGDTLARIAMEKAGIFVEGKPVVLSPQDPEAWQVLIEEANEHRCSVVEVTEPLSGYALSLAGPHQAWNAAVALAAVHAAGIPLKYDTVQYGLSTVRWPGRFERFDVPGKPPVILDGAHNPHASKMLVATWDEQFGTTKCALVFSAVAAKDVAGILADVAPLAAEIHICPVDSPRALTAEELAAELPESAPPHHLHASFGEAYAAATQGTLPVLVAGSLFLVGEARALLLGGTFQRSTQ